MAPPYKQHHVIIASLLSLPHFLTWITLVNCKADLPVDFTLLRQLSQPDVFTNPECNATRCSDKFAGVFGDCECQCLEDASTFDLMFMRCNQHLTDGQNVWFGSIPPGGVAAVLLPLKGDVIHPMLELFTNVNGGMMEPLSKHQPCWVTSVLCQVREGWLPCVNGEKRFFISMDKSQLLLKWNDSMDSTKNSMMGKLLRISVKCANISGDLRMVIKTVGSLSIQHLDEKDVNLRASAANNLSTPLAPLPKLDEGDNLVLIISLPVTLGIIVIAVAIVLVVCFVMQQRAVNEKERAKNFEGFLTPQTMTNPVPNDVPDGPLPGRQSYDDALPTDRQPSPRQEHEPKKSTGGSPKWPSFKGLSRKTLKRQDGIPPGDDSYQKNWLQVKEACRKTVSLPPRTAEYWRSNPYIPEEPRSHNQAMQTIRSLFLRAKDKVRGRSSLMPIYEEEEAPSVISGSNLSIDSALFSMSPKGSVSSDRSRRQSVSNMNNAYVEEIFYHITAEMNREIDRRILDEYSDDNSDGVEFGDGIFGYDSTLGAVPVTNIDDLSVDMDEGISQNLGSSVNNSHFGNDGELEIDMLDNPSAVNIGMLDNHSVVDIGMLDNPSAVDVKRSDIIDNDRIFYLADNNGDSVLDSDDVNLGYISQKSSSDQSDLDSQPQWPSTPSLILTSSPMSLRHVPIPRPLPGLSTYTLPPAVSQTTKHIPPLTQQITTISNNVTTFASPNKNHDILAPPAPPPPPTSLTKSSPTKSQLPKRVKHSAPQPPPPYDRSDSGMHSDSSSLSLDSPLASSASSDGQSSIKMDKSTRPGVGLAYKPKPDDLEKKTQVPSSGYQHSIEMIGDILMVTTEPELMVWKSPQDRNAVKFWDEMGYPCPNNDKERTISLQKERKKKRQKMYFNTPHRKQMFSAYNRQTIGLGCNSSQTKVEKRTWTNSMGRGRNLPGKASSAEERNVCLKTYNNLSLLRLGGVWEV